MKKTDCGGDCGNCQRCREREREEERRTSCDHENAVESHDGRGIAWHCEDFGAEGWNSYAATYGVSDADFI